MTQIEFETRTMVKVSSYEFEAINTVYMASDLNKDEFCNMWKKMNASRVKAAKETQKRMQLISDVLDIYGKKFLLTGDEWNNLAVNFLTLKEQETLKEFGVEMQGVNRNGIPFFKQNYELFYEIEKKVKLNA